MRVTIPLLCFDFQLFTNSFAQDCAILSISGDSARERTPLESTWQRPRANCNSFSKQHYVSGKT